MTTGAFIRVGFAAILAGAIFAPAIADETGFASMHSQARVGGKLCMTDHWHYGNGSGASKKAAQRDAISSWQNFTDFEYGRSWAFFRNAAERGISCSNSGGSVNCQVQARPCRR